MNCVGLHGLPCGRPASFPADPYGLAGRLCAKCRTTARRQWWARVRPFGDCACGCGLSATQSGTRYGFRGHINERCAARLARGLPKRDAYVTKIADARPLPCACCGTAGGRPVNPKRIATKAPGTPARVNGHKWKIPGPICLDCAEDAALLQCDDTDPPDAYLPTIPEIYSMAAAIRRQRSPEDWMRVRDEAHHALHALSRKGA